MRCEMIYLVDSRYLPCIVNDLPDEIQIHKKKKKKNFLHVWIVKVRCYKFVVGEWSMVAIQSCVRILTIYGLNIILCNQSMTLMYIQVYNLS